MRRLPMRLLRPCRSHKIYLCQACKDLGTVGSHLRSVTREDDEANERTTPDNNYTTPGWAMPDDAFEQMLQAVRQRVGASDAYLRRLRDARRMGRPVDPEWDPDEAANLSPHELEEILDRPLRFDMSNFTNAINAASSRASRSPP